jgi:hypothetical protein
MLSLFRSFLHGILFTSAVCVQMLMTTSGFSQKVDLNLNTMSDIWEQIFEGTALNPNLDTDGDGISNRLEALGGTNPFDPNSFPRITVGTYLSNTFSVVIECELGKRYELQSKQPLGTGGLTNWNPEASQIARSGTSMTLNAAIGPAVKLFRIGVSDVDTDSDGLNDWEEYQLGLDPTRATSNNQLDESGQPITDYHYTTSGLGTQNIVTITATDPTSVQPDPGQYAQDLGEITVRRAGFPLNLLIVNLALANSGTGFATENVDHTFISRTVSLPPGVSSASVNITPLANSNLLSPVIAKLSLMPGSGYTIGTPSDASVVIYPSQTPKGTGLTGQYYTNANSTYTNAANFNPANLRLTRTDTNVNFVWNSTNPPPTGHTNYFCVRWTGQVQPQYSETYFFVVNSDEGVKLWVNDQLIIDNWAPKSASDLTGSISLQAGVRYNIRLEYFQLTGSAVARLSWYSPNQAKQFIPANRLYPSSVTPAPSSLVNPLTAVAFLNQPFSFTVAGANSPSRLTASPIPPGLSFNSVNGLLSGTPTVAGNFQIMLTSSNSAGTGASVLYLQVIDTGSSVVREVWLNAPGVNITDIPLSQPASLTNTIGTLEGIPNFGTNYGERIRGFFTAPTTANYYFWIAGSDNAELWISNDAEAVNKVKRAKANGTGSRQWNLQTAQKSGWLALVAGQKYYIEILHKAGTGGNDNWSVAWLQDPTGTNTVATGVVPGYLLSKYYPPPPSVAPGTLYVATMLAGNGVTNMPFGTATLRLSADNSQAVLNYSVSGLSSTIIGEHVNNDPYLTHPSQIMYDISATHPQPDGSYLWNIEPVGTLSAAAVLDVLNQGKGYITILTSEYPDGELIGHFAPAEGSTSFTAPSPPPGWVDDHANANAAVRFLTQATFGPSPSEISLVQSVGYTNWLNAQLAMAPSLHLPLLYSNLNSDPTSPYSGNTVFNGWWERAVTAPDQVRQRVAFALSEILVVSDEGVLQNNAPALCMYYDTLLNHAFGNFRDVLRAVTLTPAMGEYLNMQGNAKGNIINGTHANENYAREILQLFSIGLYRYWPDGSLVMTTGGDLVSTYDQDVILGFAATFTGWNYYQPNQGNGRLPTNFGPSRNYLNPMVLVPTQHDLNAKRLLDNVVLPPALGASANTSLTNFDNYCSQDLELALDNIFYNENVAPFICRQLIQRLVTSHPSSGYLYRVALAFNNNGLGVRGDLQAVIKAILLDYEARSTNMLSVPTFGKQREPLLRVTAAARAFPSPAPVTATYGQSGLQYLTNTTAAPHRLATSDIIKMSFNDTSGQTAPASQAYSVTVINPTTFRVTPPGLTVAPYSQTTNTTITNMLAGNMVTTNIIMVNLSGHGLRVGSSVHLSLLDAGTYFQSNRMITNMITGNPITNHSIVLNIPGHGLALGDSASLHFTSGGAIDGNYQVVWLTNNNWFAVVSSETNNRGGNAYINGGAYDRLYQVIWTTNGNLFAVMTPDANARLTNNCLIHRITGGGFVVSGGTTVNYSTPQPHGLAVGNSVYIAFAAGGPASGQYQVTAVPDATHFTFSVPSTGNATLNGASVYPSLAPPTYRAGNATISWNTWSMNATDTGSTFSLAQTPLNSPTVFNFFFPDYKFPGALSAAGLTTPEFQLTSDTTVAFQMNFFQGGIFNTTNINGLSSFNNNGGAIVLDLGQYLTTGYASSAGIPALVDALNSILCAGQLSSGAKTIIVNYVTNTSNFPYGTSPTSIQIRDRVRAVLHLILVSPDYVIQR